jgi:hypothetical protein
MENKVMIKSIKNNRNLPKFLKNDIIDVLKSSLYVDTHTLISTLDKSPRSVQCVQWWNSLDPTKIRTKQQLKEYMGQLSAIRKEALKCTVNPYFYIPNAANPNLQTIGDIVLPNSNSGVTINALVLNAKYDYLDRGKMIKDFLLIWNRDAKKYLEEKVDEDREYLAKAHKSRSSSWVLGLASLIATVLAVLIFAKMFSLDMQSKKTIFLGLVALLGWGLVVFTNAVVGSFHKRKLRAYDKKMRQLDRVFDAYSDHTYNIEEKTLKAVYARKMCNVRLDKVNIVGPLIKKFDINNYVYAHKEIEGKKYGFIKYMAFAGFVAVLTVAVIVLLAL